MSEFRFLAETIVIDRADGDGVPIMRMQYVLGVGTVILLLAVAAWVALEYIPH
jgi:hypothetical protein